MHREKTIHLVRVDRLAKIDTRARSLRRHSLRRAQSKAHNHSAAGSKKITTRNIVHDPSLRLRRQHDRLHDPRVSAAPAEIAREPLLHLVECRPRRLVEQRLRRHDHAISAIAALRGLLGDEGGLHNVRLFGRAKPFESRDSAARHLPHGKNARALGFPIDQHRARAALSESATEFRPMQAERIAQDVEKRLRRIPGFDRDWPAV